MEAASDGFVLEGVLSRRARAALEGLLLHGRG